MKTMKTFFAALLLAALAVCSPASAGQVLTMTFSPPENSPHHKAGLEFARLVKEKTNGEYEVQVYPNSSLAGGNQLGAIEMVQNGAISCGFLSPLVQVAIEPNLNAPSIPWLWKDVETIDKTLKLGTPVHEELNRLVRRKGYEIIGYGENGFRELTNSVRSIRTPADMSGVKFRVVGSRMLLDVFSALGANPVDLNFSELFTALQQGTVDGQENPISTAIYANRFFEVQKFMTLWQYSYEPHPLQFNKRLWDSFPDNIRQAIQEAADIACDLQKKYARESTGTDLEEIRKYTEVVELTPEETAAFREMAMPVIKEHEATFDAALISALLKANE